MNIWFTSDTHYGHANVIKYSKRPFANLEEMTEGLIENFNSRVKPGDEVYHLGDFALSLGVPEVEAIVRRLNGNIHLLIGNHDEKNKSVLRANGFAEKLHYKTIKHDGQKMILCHYPFMTWNGSHHGTWDLHGHCHGSLKPRPCVFCKKVNEKRTARRLDMGVDCWNYFPVSFDEIKAEMDKVVFEAVDHHGDEGEGD